MPEKEFELYLSMLARMLRLNESQRASVADELRDHLESRLSGLMEAGHSREEAIRLALKDVGDAAGMATRLSTVGAIRRRRMIVRGTLVSACVLFVGLLAAGLFTPQNAPLAPPAAPAQAPPASPQAGFGDMGGGAVPVVAAAPARISPAEELRRKTDAKLEEICTAEIAFDDVPVRDCLSVLSEQLQVSILMDEKAIESEGSLSPDQNVTLKIPANSVTYRTALDLLLRSLGCAGALSFDTREGLVYLTQESQSLIVDVYNVRDLIGQPMAYGATAHMSEMMPGMASGGEGAMMSSMAGPTSAPRYTRVQFGGPGAAGQPGGSAPGMMMPGATPGAGGGGGAQGGTGPVATELGRPLVAMIVEVLEPDAWTTAGGPSSIGEVDGLLVVRTTTRMHRSLADLLAKMRAAKSGATPSAGGYAPPVTPMGPPVTH